MREAEQTNGNELAAGYGLNLLFNREAFIDSAQMSRNRELTANIELI